MGRTIWVLAVVVAFVAGSIVTGTLAFADNDDSKGNPLKKIVKLLKQILTAIEEQGGSTSSVITIITVDSLGGGISEIPTTFKQGSTTLQTGVSPEIFFATNGEIYEVFLDSFEERNFIRWSDGSIANPRIFSVTSDRTFTGVFTPPPPPPPILELSVFVVDGQADPSTFSGSEIIKVVVNDADLKDTDETETEPDVRVNNNRLRMVQETDGVWYGYFAQRSSVLIADSQVVTPGTGSDFGVFCSKDSGLVLGPTVIVTATEGFAIQDPALVTDEVNGNPTGTPLTNLCTNPVPNTTPNDLMNVLDVGNITPNFPSPGLNGQIGIRDGFWPFIQLFDFASNTDATITYNIGGGSPQIHAVEFLG